MKRFVYVLHCLPWLLVLLLVLPAPAHAAAPACPTIGIAPTSLIDGVIGNQYSQTLSATTGNPPAPFAPTAFTVDSGVLPDGVLLNAATGELLGTPTATGDFDFTVDASDANGCSGGRSYRIAIACGSFAIATPPHATAGTAYNYTLVASGGAAPYTFALSSGSPLLPTGLTLASDGTLSGTPLLQTGGSYALLIDVSDGTSCTGAPVPLTLIVDEAPAITSANAVAFEVGTAGSFQVTATGYPLPDLSETGTLPAGVTFDVTSGMLAGTPAAGSSGTYPITFMATNGIGVPATQAFTLTVNAAPAITSANTTTFTVGAAGTFTVTATGFPTPTLAEAGALPSGVTFNAASGVLSGTPSAGTGGSYPITFTASNGIGAPATQNFTLVVDEAPAITSANATTFTLGAAGTFTVTATGFPTPTLAEAGALPAGVTFNAATGVLSGTPAAGTGGSYPLTFTASNGVGAPATQNFTLAVVAGAVITSPNTTTFTVGTAGTFTVTATGTPTPTLAEAGALPAGVSFDAATGVLSGTPAAGTGGTYPITFTATNGVGAPATQNFSLVVDEAAVITSANATTFTLGTAGTFTVTATGFPTPTLAETGVLPAGVTFDAATGVLSGTPAAGSGGSYAITFTATNGVGAPAAQAFTLAVVDGAVITSPNTITFTVGTAGTFTVTTTGSPTPILSESGALPGGVTFDAATGVLSGTPAVGTGGTYPIVFTATNGVGAPATQNFSLVIDEAPAITSANATTFTIGAAGTFTVTASGHPAPTFGITGALPAGVSFITSTGVLSGTPAAGSGGTYPLVISASNGIGVPATQNFTLTVSQGAAITSPNTVTFTVGTAGTFTVTATGTPAPTLAETGALPAGVTFNAGTGVLSGTPAAGTGGTYPIVFTATNGIGAPATQNFSLIINQAPAITSANATTFVVGTAGSFSVTASGFPAPTFGLTGTLPAGVSFAAATGILSGTPAAGSGGAYPLVIIASNGVGAPATQNFTLTVNAAPAITSANATTFTVGTAGTFTVTATGTPTPTLAETGALPAGVTFNAGTGVLSGTPAAGTGGTYPITFTATNGVGAPATQSFTLTVNQAPAVTSANTTTFTIGVAGTFTVTATGFPAPTLSEGGALPAGVAFNAGTGVLSGTPAAGSGGTYPITFTATNGIGAPATQNFTLVVSQPATITSPNAVTFTVGTAGSFTVTATGFPVPTLSETGALPAGVTFNAGTGVLSGTPAAGTGGTYPITFTATNGVGAPATQAFTLTVNQAPAITSANSASFPIGTADSFTVTATGFPTPTLSETGALPGGVTFNAGTGVLSGTPGAGTAGIYPISFGATNGVGAPANQAFTLTVTCPVITVNGTLPNGSYQVPYGPQTFTQGGGAPAIAWSATGLPAGLAIGAASGQVSGTPTTTTAGVNVTVTATDAYQCTGSLTVNNFKVLPVASADAYTTVGNTPLYAVIAAPATPAVASGISLLANDLAPAGALSAALVAGPANGSLALNPNGSFSYSPNPAATSDSFSYAITDSNGVTSLPGTVNIAMNGRVWYVNGANASNGSGVASSPFNTLASASTSHVAGDTVFVESGGSPTTTAGAISLKANSSLWGQGAALPAISGITILNTGATSKPKLTGTVTLAGNNVTVSSLDIAGSTSTGLTNTGTITGAVVQNAVTVTTTTGVAVSLSNASGNFNFRSISSNGALHGIALAGVGGTFVVAGDGGATSNGSGGVIQASTAEGILAAGTGAASLNFGYMNLQNSGTGSSGSAGNTGSGIKVIGATAFVLNRSNVTDTAGGGGDEGVNVTDAANVSILNSTITGAPHNGVRIDNTGTSLASFQLTGNTIGNQTNNGSTTFGNDGLLLTIQGAAVLASGTIQGNTFQGIYATAVQIQTGASANIQAMQIGGAGAQSNTFSGNNIALDLDQDATSAFTFSVLGNRMNTHNSHAINVFSTTTSTGGSITGKIDGNLIGTAGAIDSGSAIGNGMRLNINGQTHAVLTVSNNILNEMPNGRGIEMIGRLGTGGANFKVVNNTVARPSGTNQDIGCGFHVPCPLASVWASALNSNNVCSVISGNTAYDPTSWPVGGEAAFTLANNASTLRLEGTAANATTQITNTNTITNVTGAPVIASGTITIVGANTCGVFP